MKDITINARIIYYEIILATFSGMWFASALGAPLEVVFPATLLALAALIILDVVAFSKEVKP